MSSFFILFFSVHTSDPFSTLDTNEPNEANGNETNEAEKEKNCFRENVSIDVGRYNIRVEYNISASEHFRFLVSLSHFSFFPLSLAAAILSDYYYVAIRSLCTVGLFIADVAQNVLSLCVRVYCVWKEK